MNYVGGLSLIFFVSLLITTGCAQYHDAVLLGDVKALTLHKGQYTSHRRQPPVLQLQCVGGTGGCSHAPDVVQCVNMGSDGIDYQWECKADLEKKVRFGKILVSCEGYSGPNDPYVLRGSCGLEYSLELTGSHHESSNYNQHPYSTFKGSKGSGEGNSYVVIIIFVVAIIAAVYWFSSQNQAQPSNPSAPPPYGFGSPPPYGFNDQSPPSGTRSPPPPYGFKSNSYGQPHETNQGGFGGFWTGAGVGGLLGYLFGSRNNNSYQSGYSTYSRPRDHSIFGGSHDFGPSTSTGFRDSTSSESRTTSGFGGTKRR